MASPPRRLLVFAAVICEALPLGQAGGAQRWPHAMAATTTFPLLFGPLIWADLRRLLEPAQRPMHSLLWHGLPWLLRG